MADASLEDGERLGRIVMLNAASSTGKMTLARAQQAGLPDPWLEIGIDRFVFALPRRYVDQPSWSEVFRYVRPAGRTDGPFSIETGPLGERLVSGMHRTVAALAQDGLDIIVDHVLLEAGNRWGGYDVEVDTSVLDPDACAAILTAAIATPATGRFSRSDAFSG